MTGTSPLILSRCVAAQPAQQLSKKSLLNYCSCASQLSFLINGTPVDALANVLHRSKATAVGRAMATRLREVIPRQQFEIAIQAVVGAK